MGLTGESCKGTEMKKTAKKIEKMGRKGDTILAHINPKEAAMLKAHGGSGGKNPKTGLLEFNEDGPGGSDTGSERAGDYNFGGLEGFAGYGGMMNDAVGSLNGFADSPNAGMSLSDQYGQYGAGRQLAEQAAGYGMGATQNLLGQFADRYSSMNPMAQSLFGGLGALGSFLGNTSLGTNTGGATGISQSDPFSGNFAGTGGPASGNNTYEGPGYLPSSDPVTPTTGTGGTGGTGGTTTTQPLYTIPPAYGDSQFTMKFGKPRDMTGLLNFGS